MKILLVEDDEILIATLSRSLATHHYVIDAVRDGEMGWTYGSTFEYDLIVLDIMLPKLDGISLCKRLRTEGYTMPILLLTAQDNSTAKVQGLDAGADDYVVKPFDQAELIARMRALLRRGCSNPLPLLTWGNLILNPSTCEVSYNNQPLALTTKEYELLELLMRDSQHVFSTEEILDRLWSSEEFPSEATVRSHIRRVRNKLVAAGAPQDFIATMHGRGYYLKAVDLEEGLPPVSASSPPNGSAMMVATALLDATETLRSGMQQQYLTFLNETWATTKQKNLDQVAILSQALIDLQGDRLDPQHQVQAQQAAHKLVGTLGIFGLTKAVHLARQLESWLGSREPLQPKLAPLMQTLVTALEQDIDRTTQIQLAQLPANQSPLLLIVDTATEFTQALGTVAESRGIRTATAFTLEQAEAWFTPELVPDSGGKPPDVILFRLPPTASKGNSTTGLNAQSIDLLKLVQAFAQHYPNLPILVMGEQSDLRDRLEVVRCGCKLFLHRSTPPEQVLAAAVHLLGIPDIPVKVMVVDDDQDWLRALPTLLKPWGFKVTTLAEPQQFWTVLQAVTPDVLVLDVNMPQINGFELCQILRSDPHWQRVPVLFLSVLNDSKSQNQGFTVGGDDYLCKPVVGVELANRILSRLRRVRAVSS